MLGFLIGAGVLAIGGAVAAKDNIEMIHHTSKVDENGNLEYYDRKCRRYLNGERVHRTTSKDEDGVTLYQTVGTSSGKVYESSYGRGTQQLLEYSEQNKQLALKKGKNAYNQFYPYFGRFVTTEISTGKIITCLLEEYDRKAQKKIYRKWYYKPSQGKFHNRTLPGDYGIEITKEEYNNLWCPGSTYTCLPDDNDVAMDLMGLKH